jgi:hypothetical protein
MTSTKGTPLYLYIVLYQYNVILHMYIIPFHYDILKPIRGTDLLGTKS